MPPESSPGGALRLRGGYKALMALAILGLLVATLALFSRQGLYKIYRLKQERSHLERENARLAEENTRLSRTIDRLQSDPEMMQDLIRRELNFIKKNEIIIQLPPASHTRPSAPPLEGPVARGQDQPRPPAEARNGASTQGAR